MAPLEFVTVGVYGWNAERFFAALQAASVDTFCDIRDRRGVRGAEYAFANSARLQARLAGLGIRYIHRRDLAPSQEVRGRQHAADRITHIARRQRAVLSDDFVDAYARERLAGFDSQTFVASLGSEARVVALCCVERVPAACHRSLLAGRLIHDLGVQVRHLVPASDNQSDSSSESRL
jgi:uncharacterized protein (DUF488 family)